MDPSESSHGPGDCPSEGGVGAALSHPPAEMSPPEVLIDILPRQLTGSPSEDLSKGNTTSGWKVPVGAPAWCPSPGLLRVLKDPS